MIKVFKLYCWHFSAEVKIAYKIIRLLAWIKRVYRRETVPKTISHDCMESFWNCKLSKHCGMRFRGVKSRVCSINKIDNSRSLFPFTILLISHKFSPQIVYFLSGLLSTYLPSLCTLKTRWDLFYLMFLSTLSQTLQCVYIHLIASAVFHIFENCQINFKLIGRTAKHCSFILNRPASNNDSKRK